MNRRENANIQDRKIKRNMEQTPSANWSPKTRLKYAKLHKKPRGKTKTLKSTSHRRSSESGF